jgi:hypothetical protein
MVARLTGVWSNHGFMSAGLPELANGRYGPAIFALRLSQSGRFLPFGALNSGHSKLRLA